MDTIHDKCKLPQTVLINERLPIKWQVKFFMIFSVVYGSWFNPRIIRKMLFTMGKTRMTWNLILKFFPC